MKYTHEVTVIHPDGRIDAPVQVNKATEYLTVSNAVGGYIETLPYFSKFDGRGCRAYCNEEGKLRGLPFNMVATLAWRKVLKVGYDLDRTIVVGPVAIVTKIQLVK